MIDFELREKLDAIEKKLDELLERAAGMPPDDENESEPDEQKEEG